MKSSDPNQVLTVDPSSWLDVDAHLCFCPEAVTEARCAT
jgi:hypothetical protein